MCQFSAPGALNGPGTVKKRLGTKNRSQGSGREVRGSGIEKIASDVRGSAIPPPCSLLPPPTPPLLPAAGLFRVGAEHSILNDLRSWRSLEALDDIFNIDFAPWVHTCASKGPNRPSGRVQPPSRKIENRRKIKNLRGRTSGSLWGASGGHQRPPKAPGNPRKPPKTAKKTTENLRKPIQEIRADLRKFMSWRFFFS